jgi:hypothetical protein
MDIKFLSADLMEPVTRDGKMFGNPPTWIVRIRFTVDGREAAALYLFESREEADELMQVAEDIPQALAEASADRVFG